MNILGTQYTLKTRSLEIYIAGCKGNKGVHCKECHNPESWNFNQGDKYTCKYFIENIKEKVENHGDLIKNIMIFGGEPLDQSISDLIDLLQDLYYLKKPIWLFTRYSLEEVPTAIKHYCEYIKCGIYAPELKTDTNVMYNIKLATSNQRINRRGLDY